MKTLNIVLEMLDMNSKYRILINLFLMVLGAGSAVAQYDETMRHHVIVSVDMAGCNAWNGSHIIADSVCNLLSYTGFDKSNERSLYNDGDYLSFLGFRTDRHQQDMSTFQLSMSYNNHKMAYLTGSRSEMVKMVQNNWQNIVLSRVSNNDSNYSLVSVAKTYALNAMRSDSMRTNRTFLVIITDHHYNGNDFYDEMIMLHEKSKNVSFSHDRVFELSYAVEKEYFIKYLKTIDIPMTQFPYHGYIELYEYVPLQRSLSLASVLELPSKVRARRCRGGKYEIVLPIVGRENTQFQVERLDVFPSIKERYKSPDGVISLSREKVGDTISLFVLRSARSDSLTLRAWLNLRDSVYNVTVLSPSRYATEFMGREGLNLNIPIEYEPDACLFGFSFLPLQDWMWVPGCSQQVMAGLWSFIIGLFILSLLTYAVYNYHYFRPAIEDLDIVVKNNKKTS